jgi:hypothetical protein
MVRRAFLYAAAVWMTRTWRSSTSASQAGDVAELPITIDVGTDSPDRILSMLRDVDAKSITEEKETGFGGVETIVAAMVVAKGLVNLVIRLSKLWDCGMVVDGRTSRVVTKRDCDLPRGDVLVISHSGKRTRLSQPSASQIEPLVSDLQPEKRHI